jgi:hypothetical protein
MFGYKFVYRHQFGLFTQDCADLIILRHLRFKVNGAEHREKAGRPG